jgi:hypothetical protein
VLISRYRFVDRSDAALLVPIGSQVTASVIFFVIILNNRMRRTQRGSSAMRLEGEGASPTLYSLAVVSLDCGLPLLRADALGDRAPCGSIQRVAANFAFPMLALAKWYREMRGYYRAGRAPGISAPGDVHPGQPPDGTAGRADGHLVAWNSRLTIDRNLKSSTK